MQAACKLKSNLEVKNLGPLEIERALAKECDTWIIDIGITRELLLELLVKIEYPKDRVGRALVLPRGDGPGFVYSSDSEEQMGME